LTSWTAREPAQAQSAEQLAQLAEEVGITALQMTIAFVLIDVTPWAVSDSASPAPHGKRQRRAGVPAGS